MKKYMSLNTQVQDPKSPQKVYIVVKALYGLPSSFQELADFEFLVVSIGLINPGNISQANYTLCLIFRWSNTTTESVVLLQTRLYEATSIPSPEPTSEAPNESLPDSSSAQSSEVPFEQQPDHSPSPLPRPSPNPSPTPIVPDSIPEPTSKNLGDHSFNDTSLLGNEDEMTLQIEQSNKEELLKKKRSARKSLYPNMGRGECERRWKAKENAQSKGVSTDFEKLMLLKRRSLLGNEVKGKVMKRKLKVPLSKKKVIEEQTKEEFATQASQTSTQTPTSMIFGDDVKQLATFHQHEDVEDTDRSRPTSTRSTLTLKPLPKIDPKDKGKKKIEEEDETKRKCKKIEAKRRRNKIAEEKATNEALIQDFDDIKARIEADRILAEKLQEQEREQFTIEERAKFLHDTIVSKKVPCSQDHKLIRHTALYEKIKRFNEHFISTGSAKDEKFLKRMNEKTKSEVIKEDTKEEVKDEDKDEESTRKRKLGTRKKMKSRKRRYIQHTSEDDTDKENDELRLCLKIAQDEEKEVDYEILDRKYPIIDWKTECLGTKPQPDEAKSIEKINLNVVTRSNGQQRHFSVLTSVLSIFDREDLNAVYQLVMNKYQDEMPEGFERVLWGDLMVLFNPDEQDEFWSSQHEWKIISWKLHNSSGVHTLMTNEGVVIHMLTEKKYPLKKEILVQMLNLRLESEEESTMALELIRFIKKVLADLESKEQD
ncbi:hypothetical protein Tco_0572567 [Tanacetum coccineum]